MLADERQVLEARLFALDLDTDGLVCLIAGYIWRHEDLFLALRFVDREAASRVRRRRVRTVSTADSVQRCE